MYIIQIVCIYIYIYIYNSMHMHYVKFMCIYNNIYIYTYIYIYTIIYTYYHTYIHLHTAVSTRSPPYFQYLTPCILCIFHRFGLQLLSNGPIKAATHGLCIASAMSPCSHCVGIISILSAVVLQIFNTWLFDVVWKQTSVGNWHWRANFKCTVSLIRKMVVIRQQWTVQ